MTGARFLLIIKNMNNKLAIFTLTVIAAFLCASNLFAFQANVTTDVAAELKKVPAGQTVLDFIEAINSGELEKMRDFHRAHGGQTGLAEQDLQFAHASGGVIPEKVLSISETGIELLVQAKKDQRWMVISFEIENRPPYALNGLDIRPGSPPGNGKDDLPSEKPVTAESESDALIKLEERLDKIVGEDEFSGVVLVAKDGNPVFHKAYGLADKGKNVPNQPDTKFNLGSINKIFTRIAISQLIEQGKLSPDETLGKLLPDYPNKEAREKITVHHLLNMTSGIGDFFTERYDAAPKEKIQSLKDYLPFFADKPLEFEPGTSNRYSNGGYLLLGLIIEKVSGMDYYAYVKKNVFGPAGMSNTDSYSVDQGVPNLARGYTKHGTAGKDRVLNAESLPGRGSSAGGGYSTAGDILKFAVSLKSGELRIDAGSKQFEGIGIAGGAPGISAVLEINPEYTIIVMSNYDPPTAEDMGRFARKLLKGLPK